MCTNINQTQPIQARTLPAPSEHGQTQNARSVRSTPLTNAPVEGASWKHHHPWRLEAAKLAGRRAVRSSRPGCEFVGLPSPAFHRTAGHTRWYFQMPSRKSNFTSRRRLCNALAYYADPEEISAAHAVPLFAGRLRHLLHH